MMSILISEALKAAGGIIGTETVKAMIPLVKKYGKKAKAWLEQNVVEIPAEIPVEVQEEIQEIAQRYFESQKCPVYMDGVIFFFYEELDDETKQTLRELIEVTDWDSSSCSEEECTIYVFTNRYMGGEREENDDFGFEHDSLYLNFAQQGMSDELYNEADIRECADALNQFLKDNEIESFVTFR